MAAFTGGMLISFTPCVYPLIPISIGYIGVRSDGSRVKALSLSFVYVTGVAITYAALGVIAALTGSIFGRISVHPITRIVVGAVIIISALSLFDIFNLTFFTSIKLPQHKKGNYFSTFFLGLASGLIVSPCLTPVLGSILLYLATKRNVTYAIVLLLSFAYGMGLMLILGGVFSTILWRLPQIGKWLVWAKRLAALILIALGIYFIIAGIRRL